MRELPPVANCLFVQVSVALSSNPVRAPNIFLELLAQVDVGFLHLMHDSMVRTGDE